MAERIRSQSRNPLCIADSLWFHRLHLSVGFPPKNYFKPQLGNLKIVFGLVIAFPSEHH